MALMETTGLIAACVVLYHPSADVYDSIASYYKDVDYLVAIDNSEIKNEAFERELRRLFPKAIYLFQGRNLGIAAALNIACRIAVKQGCRWLLTMDQDSHFENDGAGKMLQHKEDIIRHYHHVGIITPYHVVSRDIVNNEKEKFTERNIAMTSGNLLNLDAWLQSGEFEEKLFIDYVDYEYCLRLRRNNWKIIQDNSVWLNHSLGDFTLKRLLGFKISVSHHNHKRWYYKIRNSLYVGFRYARFDKRFLGNVLLMNILFEPLFVIPFYEKQKWLKLKSVARGITDFIRGKFGMRNF